MSATTVPIIGSNTGYTYPSPMIDPRQKDHSYILQFVKAAYHDSRGYAPMNPLNQWNTRYAEIKMYALGKQSIDNYKKQLLTDSQQDNSWLAIDWNPLALLPKYREIAISKLVQREYDVQCFAVDALAKSDEDAYFTKMKVKIMLRQAAQQSGADVSKIPALMPEPGEPEDLEALEKEQEYGYKHVMSMEAELAHSLIFQQNNGAEKRKRTNEYNFDYGLGGYHTWIDENGMVKFEEINPELLLLSSCEKNDFSDMTHYGLFKEVYAGDLAPYYTREQMTTILQTVAGKWGNSRFFEWNGQGNIYSYYNRFKVLILKFKFKDWNTTVYKEEVDGRGNVRFNKTKYKNLSVSPTGDLQTEAGIEAEFNAPLYDTGETGSATPKYKKLTKEVVYKCTWVVGTDFMHDYGLSENMVRKQSNWWETSLDIQLYAWNFYRMQWAGITERLIPLEDKACLTWFRLQNLTNKLIPYLINIDFNAVEAVNFGKSGKKSSPAEIMDFIFSNFVVPYRSTDLLSRNPNYKPVNIEPTGQLAAFSQLYEDLQNTIQMMRQVSGLNEITDGSTPNAKNLNGTTEAAVTGTNNALYLLMNADKQQLISLADSIISKVQIAVKLGKVSGYAKALGNESVSFLEINPDIQNYQFGIFFEDAPTKEERQILWQSLNQKEYQGLIEPSDKILIMSCRNLKQADMELAYRIKKRKEEAQQNAIQQQQLQQQGEAQIQMQIEQMKQQTIQMQTQGQLTVENMKGEWQFRIEAMKKQSDQTEAQIQAQAKTIGNQIQADAKKEAAHIAAGSHIAGTHLKGQADLLMTEMDNQTDKETANKKKVA